MTDEQPKNPPDVMVICDAYESGYGHGFQNDGMRFGFGYFATEEEATAYDLGYEKGQAAALKPKAVVVPEGWRLVEPHYDRIFNAIGAAVTLGHTNGLHISVRKFWKYLDENQPEPPKG